MCIIAQSSIDRVDNSDEISRSRIETLGDFVGYVLKMTNKKVV
jgi:hypothetical protein